MKTVEEWAEHYGLDPNDESAKADYLKYQEGVELGRRLFADAGADDDLEAICVGMAVSESEPGL